MAKLTLEFTTEELHKLTFAVQKYKELLPDQTPKERQMLWDLVNRFNKAYVDADYIDFKESHKEIK